MLETRPFGSWLRQVRAESDLTQAALAEQVGCAVQTLRLFERGLRRPSRELAERLADVLQIPAEQRATFLHAARIALLDDAGLPQAPAQADAAIDVSAAAPRRVQLPTPSTILIGREAERQAILTQLAAPVGRLVTLIGPGGIGKTQLALQVASDLAAGHAGIAFADGVAFIALAPVADATNVATAIAEAIGCPLPGTVAPDAHLLAFLRERSLLLVLDNLEHLLGPGQGQQISDLISAIGREAAGVRLLVTSRERLRLRDERVVELSGLALPSQHSDAIERSDAVLLFVERAAQTIGDFALTPDNRDAVAQICRLLDGAPLAIELAATWVRALSCDEIANEVTHGLDFLALSDRDAEPRHRSMRAVIEHSWQLLAEDERRVLARLSVFRGGCGREAAGSVAGATLPILVALIDKSLLRHTPAGRYEMHELLRQYAEAQLAADPQAAADASDTHCAYFATFVNRQRMIIKGPQQHVAVAQLLADIDNIRAARQHAIAHRLVEPIWQMEDHGTLEWFYELRSWYHEGAAMARQTAEALRDPPATTRKERILLGNAIGVQGWFTFRYGQPDAGMALLEESLALLLPLDHLVFLFFTLEQLSYILFFNGAFERSVALQDQALEVAQRINEPWITSHALFLRATIYEGRDPDLAYARFHEGIAHIRMVGDRLHLVLSLLSLGSATLERGDAAEAERLFAEVLARSAEVGNGVSEVAALAGLAMVACTRGAWAAAIEQCRAALARSQQVGDLWSRTKVLLALSSAYAGSGDQVAARSSFSETIGVGLGASLLPMAIDAWVGLAELDAQAGNRDILLSILALIRRHPATNRSTVVRADRLWSRLAEQAGAAALRHAEQHANRIGPDELGRLLSAYIAGHAERMLAAYAESGIEPEEKARVAAPRSHVQLSILNAQFETLTEREMDVLRLLAAGRSNQQIASELIVAIGTVKRHVNSILGKLQVESRLAAVVRARELNLLA